MIDHPDAIRIPLGVLAERRAGVTKWADEVWRVVEVLDDPPDIPAWTQLRAEEGSTLFFAGTSEAVLNPSDTDNFKHNIDAASPSVWVVLRAAPTPPGLVVQLVTVDAGEAEGLAGAGDDLLEQVPMPPGLLNAVRAYIVLHHRERGFWKRRRDGGGDWRQKREEEEE